MTHSAPIHSLKIEGSVCIDEGIWSRSPDTVMRWLSDGYRTAFNNFRQRRSWRGQTHETREPLTRSQFKHSTPFREALPASLLQNIERAETAEWRAILSGARALGVPPRPGFRSAKRAGVTFRVASSYVEVRRLSRHRGEVIIGGENPRGAYGPERLLRWRLRLRFRWTRDLPAHSSIHVDWGRRTVTFIAQPVRRLHRSTGAVIGIDLGVMHAVTTSAGEHHDAPRPDRADDRKYAALQRRAARQARVNADRSDSIHSNRRDRTLARMRELRRVEVARRRDWAEQLSAALVRDHDLVAVEALRIQQMTRRGQRKCGLNRAILRSGWGLLRRRLVQKGSEAGIAVVAVDPRHTSQTCYQCGHVARENRESQAVFACQRCGHTANADINAALNILDRGLLQHGPGHGPGRGARLRPEEATAFNGAGAEPSTSSLAVA